MPAAYPFTLERPRSVDEAVAILAEAGEDGRIMAGGQSLTPLLTLGFSSPSVVVSLDRCAGVDRIERAGDLLSVGAMVTTAAVEARTEVADACPLLATAASRVGSPHVRNFGTAVGNVCHADPGSDLIPALLCFDADIGLRSPTEQRVVPLEEFVVGPFTTTIADPEMAVDVRVRFDDGPQWRHGYRKLVKRAGDLAMTTCAVRLRCDGQRVAEARIAVGGAVARARRLPSLEVALADSTLGDVAEIALRSEAFGDVEPDLMSDLGAPVEYLRVMVPRFVAATIADAAGAESRD